MHNNNNVYYGLQPIVKFSIRFPVTSAFILFSLYLFRLRIIISHVHMRHVGYLSSEQLSEIH